MTMIRKEGHIIGNHGYYHLKGTKTSLENYISNTEKAAPLTSSRIFRPPYGLITPLQYKALSVSYTIVFWDVMPYDYDPLFGSQKSLKMALRNIRNGSVIALHDKPAATSPGFLRDLIRIALSEGYRFDIPDLLIHED
jgi:peptidoglycan/xylan/chitin deacetylase (PgdA/CDA1 family)